MGQKRYIYIIKRWTKRNQHVVILVDSWANGSTDVGLRSISILTTVLAHQLLSELNSLMVLRWSETRQLMIHHSTHLHTLAKV